MKPPKYDIKEFPAFPVSTPSFSLTGMTMRDYFAAKAMQSAFLASCTDENATLAVLNKAKTGLEYEDWLAYSAYAMADAMLKAREA